MIVGGEVVQVAIGSWCQIKADMTWSRLHPGHGALMGSACFLTAY